jgi:hypothetical protein
MTKLSSLTQEQIDLLPSYVEEGLKIGLSTERIDQKRATAAVKLAYKCVGLKMPKKVIFTESPYAGLIEAKKLDSDVYTCFGSHDISWIQFYKVFYDFTKDTDKPLAKKILGLYEVAKECGWWWPFDDVVIISDRPATLSRDDQNRLHNETGPAISYTDGYALYAVHGVVVPEDVIMDRKSITVSRIDNESNAEVRRVMTELYGEANYIQDSKLTPVHKDITGILYRKEVPGDEPICMIRVLNSTPEADGNLTRKEAVKIFGKKAVDKVSGLDSDKFKEYWLGVPPDMKTAAEAVAWTFGLTESEYQPERES